MFGQLSAYALTPLVNERLDSNAFARVIEPLVAAKVPCISVLGSTGCAPYLTLADRNDAAKMAISIAGDIPVMVGISAIATRDVLMLAEKAQQAGAKGLLVAPLSYQPLQEQEVFGLYQQLNQQVSIPICVYENPRTTQFHFSDALRLQLAQLPWIKAFKIPGLNGELIKRLAPQLPSDISLGVAGDALAANAIVEGAAHWHSVLAGTFPAPCMAISQLLFAGNNKQGLAQARSLAPLWALFSQYGSLKVMAVAASLMGVAAQTLPKPLLAISEKGKNEVYGVLKACEWL
ncbi:dihydrodipicolinate synthase family protein [Gallaecimonas mangrovi]|uniref:dihydrodipicolinate synthase family protein n=1 Tax=Gallaecimonas mangrovi TaxID=2291597 RepID=UPI000E1FE52E|nr:dihydrodipicolinate synthase family protein [Gallaecimonas mangrovi]